MKKILLLFLIPVLASAQQVYEETAWDQGVPVLFEDPATNRLIEELSPDSLRAWDQIHDSRRARKCYQIGRAFQERHMYEGADWYLNKVRDWKPDPEPPSHEELRAQAAEETVAASLQSLTKDQQFLSALPKSYDALPSSELRGMLKKIETEIRRLTHERDSLVQARADSMLIQTKSTGISTLQKERSVIHLTIEKGDLATAKERYRKFLSWAGAVLVLLTLAVIVLLQRKTIRRQDTELERRFLDIKKKNVYLEYAASLIRHDMHSGINTYMPRGLSSLERRVSQEQARELKIDAALKLIRDGLDHTKRVYARVHEFTDLVKKSSALEKEETDLCELLTSHFEKTQYHDQLEIADLGKLKVNPSLFCIAIDRLVKYAVSLERAAGTKIKITEDPLGLALHVTGISLTDSEFEEAMEKSELSLSAALFSEHGLQISLERSGQAVKFNISGEDK